MTTWLILGGYLAVWLLYGWRLTIHFLDHEVRRSEGLYGDAEKAAREWLGLSLAGGFLTALFWPVTGPVRGAFRLARSGGLFRTPTERAAAQRVELEALRKLARDHGLPMPGGDA